jgi:hypothetical protein
MLTSSFYSFSGTKRNIQWKKIAEKKLISKTIILHTKNSLLLQKLDQTLIFKAIPQSEKETKETEKKTEKETKETEKKNERNERTLQCSSGGGDEMIGEVRDRASGASCR